MKAVDRNKFILIFFTCCLFAFCSHIYAQDLSIITENGDEQVFSIQNIQTLTFQNKSLLIQKKDGAISSLPFENVKRIHFNPVNSIDVVTEPSALLYIYPNPVKEILQIKYSGKSKNGILYVKIISADGRKAYQQKIDSHFANSYGINVTGWSKGIYLLYVNDGRKVFTMKFIKK